MNTLKVKKLHPEATLPKYQTAGAACFDLHTFHSGWILPGNGVVFRTGLSFEVPTGYVMVIYSRSGHGFKNGVRLANCVGVIDSDYRGELLICLTNDCQGAAFNVSQGDRIAQAMLVPLQQWGIEEVNELSDTARGEGGFGSTGA